MGRTFAALMCLALALGILGVAFVRALGLGMVEGGYHYTFSGAEHDGRRLGLASRESGDWLGDWHLEMTSFLSRSRAEGRTIAVYVNPDKPQQSVVDRDIRWGLVAYRVLETLFMAVMGIGIWKSALQSQPNGS